MVALGVVLFFALATGAVALLLFPEAREGASDGIGRLVSRVGALVGRWQSGATTRAGGAADTLRNVFRRAALGIARHRYPAMAAVLLLAIPPLLVLSLRERPTLESFEATELDTTNPRILELLRGERLLPPAEPPPEVFTAAEAEAATAPAQAFAALERPIGLSLADRRWARIDPQFQQRVLAVFQLMREQGYAMVLVEGYRSPERQAALAAQGGVTLAGAGRSCHQYGLAADAALLRDGRLQWDMRDPWTREGYLRFGELARQAGLEWGGSWRRLKDYVHVEWKDACRHRIRNAKRS